MIQGYVLMFVFLVELLLHTIICMIRSAWKSWREPIWSIGEHPLIVGARTERNKCIISNMRLARNFKPLWFAMDSVSQTVMVEAIYKYILPFLSLSAIYPPFITEYLKTDDNQTLVLKYFNMEGAKKRGVVVLIPGIGGTTKECYNVPWYEMCRRNGLIGVVVNRRGFLDDNAMNLRSARRLPTHADTEDMCIALDHIAHKFADLPRFALGYSAGGNHLIKCLGSLSVARQRELVTAVASISCNNEIMKTHRFLRSSRMFDTILSMGVNGIVRRNRFPFTREALARPSLTRVDTCIARASGFDTVQQYYEHCSSTKEAYDIAVPMLLLFSTDDPLLDGMSEFAHDLAQKNENVIAVMTKRGGHVAWIQDDYTSWAPGVLTEYIGSFI